MGTHPNINYDKFPKQSNLVGQPVEVCFFYDTSRIVLGKMVRDDLEEPWETIIQIGGGDQPTRFVRGVECQFR